MKKLSYALIVSSWLISCNLGLFETTPREYDYYAVIDCLVDPPKPLYDGGILANLEINDDLYGSSSHGRVNIEQKAAKSENKFAMAHDRKRPYNNSVSHKVILDKDKLYTFSAWIKVTRRNHTIVTAVFKTSKGFEPVGSVVAHVGCWSMLKGGITVTSSGPAEFYFQSKDASSGILIDSVSFQPFSIEEWRSHQDKSIEKVRKAKVRLQVLNSKGRPLPNSSIVIRQTKLGFPFGVSINHKILSNAVYQNWFTKRFTVSTFENEMKWYVTEKIPGKENYSVADAMFDFTTQHGVLVRGHTIFWDDIKYQPLWVKRLSPNDLDQAANKRLNSIVTRYRGRVIAWDVNNENLHFNFFESKLGANITSIFFQKIRELDEHAMLFVNEFNTVEYTKDPISSPSMFIHKIREVRGNLDRDFVIGIGVQGHFGNPINLPYLRSGLDTLAATNLPIWITELDVFGPNQILNLKEVLREVHAHPGIQGVIMWEPWSPNDRCFRMCLVDSNFKNLPTGDVVDKLLREWGNDQDFHDMTDYNGFLNISLYHGNYEVKVLQQKDSVEAISGFVKSQSFNVDHGSSLKTIKIVTQSFS